MSKIIDKKIAKELFGKYFTNNEIDTADSIYIKVISKGLLIRFYCGNRISKDYFLNDRKSKENIRGK